MKIIEKKYNIIIIFAAATISLAGILYLKNSDSTTDINCATLAQYTQNQAVALEYDTAAVAVQSRLNALFEERHRQAGFNGAALVAVNGKIVFEKYMGYGDVEQRDTLTPESLFHIASVSKTFTGMGILWLQTHHFLNINDAVCQYLPTFPYPELQIKHLLMHRSGLSNYSYFAEPIWKDRVGLLTNEAVLHLLDSLKLPLINPPDTHFQYCNTNFVVLAQVIQKASGMAYADFLGCVFFKPLGMTHTRVYQPAVQPQLPENGTRNYMRNARYGLEFDDGTYGDKNIYSTVQDLYKWDKALNTLNLVDAQLLQAAYTPYSNEHAGLKNYGLAWRLLCYPDGKKIVYHNGWWHGNCASIYRFGDEKLTFIVLANKYNRSTYQMQPLYDAVHGEAKAADMEFAEE